MSDVMMKALQLQVESLARQVDQLGPENQRVRKLLTEFDQRHDTDQSTIEALTAERDALRADECDPDGCAAHISAFASQVDALTAQLAQRDAALKAADELILALHWYADQSAIIAKPTIDAQWASNRLRDDRGATGRHTIAAYRKARGQDA